MRVEIDTSVSSCIWVASTGSHFSIVKGSAASRNGGKEEMEEMMRVAKTVLKDVYFPEKKKYWYRIYM